jgi:glycosyltransferase involved in cell wall biosynthesis
MLRSMHIVFLASNRKPKAYQQDPAFIYRCENLGHALQALGLQVEWGHSRAWRGRTGVDCAVVHRPRLGFAMWQLVRRLKRAGARLIADFDDLVFDEGYARYSPAVRNGRSALWLLQRRFREHHAAVRWFDHITVSTEALREHAQRCFPGKPVTVLHNAVHWHWRRGAHSPAPWNAGDRIITYLPGTRSHDRDFALIAEPLTRFLRAHPEVRLRVTGPVDFQLDLPESRVLRAPKVPFAVYPQQFTGAWVNLAPLEDTPFNAAKSALKVLEAGYWGLPTLCSPNPDYARFADAGALVAPGPDAWVDWLERLLDPAEYRRIIDGLRERTLALADVQQQARLFLLEVAGRPG